MLETHLPNPTARRPAWNGAARDDLFLRAPEARAQAPADALLERAAEMSVLAERIAVLRGATAAGACVLLSAEAGGGKTSLLTEAARRAAADVEWLWGACEPMLSPPPLGALIDLLERLPPSLATAVRAARHTPEVIAGMLALLRERQTPAVLVIDDVQWADGATLDLLRYVGRRIESTRALLVLSYRDEALGSDHPLIGVLSGLPARACTRLRLAPLSGDAVAELARRAGRSARGLHRVTQGNPFFVTELLAGAANVLPASVRDAVLARAALLPIEVRDVLELASVAPAQVEIEVLDALVDDARARVDACAAAGLLQLDGSALRFRHELARRAIEASLTPGRAAALHAAMFDALSVRGAGAARLVHHAAHAGLSGAVLALAPQAAREAAQASAHRQAAVLYGLALEHAAAASTHGRAALHVAHADECVLVNRVDDAMVSRREALALHRQVGDLLAEGMDLRALACIEWCRGDAHSGQPYAQAAIEVLEQTGAPRELAMAYATMAQLHLLGEAAAPASEWGLKALALVDDRRGDRVDDSGDDPGDAEGLACALYVVGAAQLRSDDAPEAWNRLNRSLAIALGHGLEEHVGRAYVCIASLYLVHRRYADFDRSHAEGLAYCAAHDMDMYLCRLQIRRGYALLESGQWSAAEAQITAVRQTAALTGLQQEQSAHLQALLDLRRGCERADAYWTDMIEGRHVLSVDPWYAPQAVARCEAAWLRGDDAQVRQIALAALATLNAATRNGEGWCIGQLACWLRRAGGDAPHIASGVAAPCGLELAGDLRAAAAAWAALGCRYEQALALLGGDAADLRRAHALLDELGAAPAARIARRRLRALGVRDLQRGTNRRTRDDPLGLTARERQVLELLAKALSNRAIAQQLHRSERTVENHVAALLGKLGVATRTQAAALAQARKIGGATAKTA